MKTKATRTVNLLLSGKHPNAKKFAGKQVLVIEDKVLPLQRGKSGLSTIDKLEKKYGKTPTIVFVPRQDVSYVLYN